MQEALAKAELGDAPALNRLNKLCVEDPLTLRCAPPSHLPATSSGRAWCRFWRWLSVAAASETPNPIFVSFFFFGSTRGTPVAAG